MQTQFKTIDPVRIRVAREVAGLTKAQLADLLDIHPRSINTFEKEGAPRKHREALAAATGRPLGFFTGEGFDPIEVERVQFRSAKKISKKTKAESTSLGAIGLQFYAKFVKPFTLPAVDLPTLDNLSPEIAAQRVRTVWQLREDPLPNMIQLFESRGIRVLSLPHSIEKLDAFSYWYTDGIPYIFLNTSKTAERVRFDLAHELGHLVMHSSSTNPEGYTEKEADRFAAEFLMPTRAVRRDMPAYASVESILDLKRRYRVSAMAMNYRGGELGILKEWGQRQNYVELAKLGYRTDEPDGLLMDRSRVIPFVLKQMREQGKSIARLAAGVGVTMQDVNGFTFGEVLAPVPAARGLQRTDSVSEGLGEQPALRLIK